MGSQISDIRIRLERPDESGAPTEGIVFHKNGRARYLVVIEIDRGLFGWEPVEVVLPDDERWPPR